MTEELWYLMVKDGSDFLLKIDINIYILYLLVWSRKKRNNQNIKKSKPQSRNKRKRHKEAFLFQTKDIREEAEGLNLC